MRWECDGNRENWESEEYGRQWNETTRESQATRSKLNSSEFKTKSTSTLDVGESSWETRYSTRKLVRCSNTQLSTAKYLNSTSFYLIIPFNMKHWKSTWSMLDSAKTRKLDQNSTQLKLVDSKWSSLMVHLGVFL